MENEIGELVVKIGSLKQLRVEQWRGKHRDTINFVGAWRAGIEWYGEDSYEFICEYPTLLECLKKIDEFMSQK